MEINDIVEEVKQRNKTTKRLLRPLAIEKTILVTKLLPLQNDKNEQRPASS